MSMHIKKILKAAAHTERVIELSAKHATLAHQWLHINQTAVSFLYLLHVILRDDCYSEKIRSEAERYHAYFHGIQQESNERFEALGGSPDDVRQLRQEMEQGK